MKAARSSGHGMDLTAGRNGVPASCPGVQIRQDSFNVALYPSFPLYGWKELVPKPGKMAGGWQYAKSRCDHLF